MAPHPISTGRSSARGAHRPRLNNDAPAQLEIVMVAYSRALVDHRNHYGYDGTHNLEVAYAFDKNVPLFLDRSSPERIESFINDDTHVNEVADVPNTSRNELAKTEAQYPDRETRFSGWIQSTDTQ
ncbi:uncharacterized protein A4U43_C05F11950 [Asparagus officinalis]|uniref:Uncharacterized protein n=1 Tax=Asparagus officinalis TaxID=4686 RepID=A0A5P1ER36_ASPOF|nr:uncharacterized protein A4U43_C05F11950 [Asparagus officinalis]